MSPLSHPKVKAAVEREEETREAPFLGIPFHIAGIPVPPLTLRQFLTLRLIGSPFLCGGNPTAADVAAFLYVVTNQGGDKAEFAKGIAGADFLEACADIQAYKEEAFFDRGPSNGIETRVYWSEPADLVDLFGREYGWDLGTVMDTPIAVILQLLKKISHRATPDAPLFNLNSAVEGVVQGVEGATLARS
jgi:hypothetical protein